MSGMANQKLLKTLKTIIDILFSNKNLDLNKSDLLNFSEKEIETPIGNVLPLLFVHKSILVNNNIKKSKIVELIKILNINNSIIRLNHIGFCYRVTSQKKEKERLVNLIRTTNFHLYEEKSIDDGLWLFVGDTNKWEKPMIELLPVKKITNQWVEYYLPNIHIDIDTTLNSTEIGHITELVLGKEVEPYPITIKGITYIERIHLGTYEGVNIFLDLATNARNVKFHRENILKKIS
jgi:hypothetical protein